MDNPDLTEKYIDEIWDKIYQMHRDGIPFETIDFALQDIIEGLYLMSESERALLGK